MSTEKNSTSVFHSIAAAPLSPHTSAQIAILRPICIFFMLYVHVNPGFDSAIHSGATLYFGVLVVDILGRTSVAALCLVSGFLLAYGATRKDSGTLIRSRIRTLYLPMLVWSAIYMSMVLAGSALLGYESSASRALGGLPVSRLVLEKLMFLYGTPASQALGFLRDLTASSILVILLMRFPGTAVIWVAMLAVFGVILFGTMAPVVFRPTILLFMLAGVALYRRQGNLNIPRPCVIVAAFLFIALVIGRLSGFPTGGSALGLNIDVSALNVAKRTILTVLVLALGSALVASKMGKWLRRISHGAYLTYLCHTTVISMLWAIWKRGVGNETNPAYLIFFALCPVFVMALAIRIGPLIDYLPYPIQIGLRGKARAPASRSVIVVEGVASP